MTWQGCVTWQAVGWVWLGEQERPTDDDEGEINLCRGGTLQFAKIATPTPYVRVTFEPTHGARVIPDHKPTTDAHPLSQCRSAAQPRFPPPPQPEPRTLPTRTVEVMRLGHRSTILRIGSLESDLNLPVWKPGFVKTLGLRSFDMLRTASSHLPVCALIRTLRVAE